MKKEKTEKRIVAKRFFAAFMAAAFLCCFGCGKAEEEQNTVNIFELYIEDTDTANANDTQQTAASQTEQTPAHIVNGDDVKLRGGPGTSHEQIAVLNKGTEVTVYFSEDGWHKVKTAAGQEGFIRADYVSTIGNNAADSSYGRVNARNVHLRAGSATSYTSITKLSKGTELTIYSLENGWYKVKTAAGQEGYINADFVSTTEDTAAEEETAKTPQPTEKPKKTEKPEETEKPKKGNTPYKDSYTSVSIKKGSGKIDAFSTEALSGDKVTEAYFADGTITLINYWSTT